jgi:hypothetical protein
MAITCWHVGTAFIALLQACRIEHLAKYANEDLDILSHTVKQLQHMWASANVIARGFDRLRKPGTNPSFTNNNGSEGNLNATSVSHPVANISHERTSSPSNNLHLDDDEEFDWLRYFPFVTKSTSGITESLISGKEQGTATRGFPSPNNALFHDTLLAQFQDLFDPFTDYTLGFPDLMATDT